MKGMRVSTVQQLREALEVAVQRVQAGQGTLVEALMQDRE